MAHSADDMAGLTLDSSGLDVAVAVQQQLIGLVRDSGGLPLDEDGHWDLTVEDGELVAVCGSGRRVRIVVIEDFET